jgi:hypothetical protein
MHSLSCDTHLIYFKNSLPNGQMNWLATGEIKELKPGFFNVQHVHLL